MAGWFNPDKPLWLPTGTIRALLTFSVLGTSVLLMTANRGGEHSIAEWWVALTVFVIKDYFSVRESERAREEMDKVLKNMHEERTSDRILDSQERTKEGGL